MDVKKLKKLIHEIDKCKIKIANERDMLYMHLNDLKTEINKTSHSLEQLDVIMKETNILCEHMG